MGREEDNRTRDRRPQAARDRRSGTARDQRPGTTRGGLARSDASRNDSARGGSSRGSSTRGGSARRRYSDGEILRNRIIAVAVLVVLVVLLASLVTCAARAIGANAGNSPSESSASSPSSTPITLNAAGSSGAAGSSSQEQASQQAPSSAAAEGASAGSAPSESPSAASAQPSSSAASAQPSAIVSAIQQRIAPHAAEAAAQADYRGVEDPWVEGGLFTTGDAELDRLVKDYCDGNSAEDLSAAENAFNAFCHITWSDFEENEDNQAPTGPTWDIGYAKQFFQRNAGNCYDVSAAAEYALKYFGYSEAYAEPCFILRQSGEYGNHGLVYVTDLDGSKRLCDCAFGANGWMLDADIYTVKLMDIGQDPAEFTIAPFEEVVPAPW